MGEIQIQSLPHVFRWPVHLILLPCARLVCHRSAEVRCPSAQRRWWGRGPRAPEGRSLDGSQPPGCTLPCGSTPRPVEKGWERLCRSQLSVVFLCNGGRDLCRQDNLRALPVTCREDTLPRHCHCAPRQPMFQLVLAGSCCYLPSLLGPRFPCLGPPFSECPVNKQPNAPGD